MFARISMFIVTLALGLALFFGPSNDAAAEDREVEAEHCVSLTRIERADVLDDRNILFYMRGDTVYLNKLPHKCPGLRWDEPIMYRSSIGQLCDLDIITILHNTGFGFQSGPSCGLGMFHPLSEEEAEALVAERDADESREG